MSARSVRAILLACAAVLLGAPALAAAPAPTTAASRCEGRTLDSRVIEVRFRALADAAVLVDQLLGPCGSYRVPKALGVIVVEDEPESLARIVSSLASWDVPPPTVEVSVSLVLATREPPPAEGIREDLQDVSEMLSQITRWTSYTRLGSALLRVVEGGTAQADLGDRYRVSFRIHAIDRDLGVVRLEPFDLLRLPHPSEAASGVGSAQVLLANSVVNLFEGRQNVVGAGSRQPERALFVVFEVWTKDAPARAAVSGGE